MHRGRADRLARRSRGLAQDDLESRRVLELAFDGALVDRAKESVPVFFRKPAGVATSIRIRTTRLTSSSHSGSSESASPSVGRSRCRQKPIA